MHSPRRAPDAGARDRRLTAIGSYIDSVSQAEPVSMKRLMKGLDEGDVPLTVEN